jgi:hypothetical protein
MAYENIMTGQPQNLYQQKKREREIFEANEKQRALLAQRQQAQSLSQQKPTEIPSIGGLLGGVKETVGGWFDPKVIDKAEYDAAGNPMFTYDKTPGASTYETPAGVPSVGMGGKLTPEARQTYPAGGHHPGVETNQPGNVPVAAGGSGMHPGMESGYQPVYGQENPKPKEVTHTDYTKSIDKSFLAALAMSAIPEKKPTTQARAVSSGGVGRTTMPEMTPFLTGLRPKKKNPALWRYS